MSSTLAVLMCDTLVRSFDAITNINWLELIKALAPVATAFIAFCALKNWKRQDKAKREVEFLDSLLEVTHAFIEEMSNPITFMSFVKSDMNSYKASLESNGDEFKVKENLGAISYIQKRGAKDAEYLRSMLEAARPSVIKLRSLAEKGQIFNFNGYAKCQNAVKVLTGQFTRLEAFMSVIRLQDSNWGTPEVTKLLKGVTEVDESEMILKIDYSKVTIINFVRDSFKGIYS